MTHSYPLVQSVLVFSAHVPSSRGIFSYFFGSSRATAQIRTDRRVRRSIAEIRPSLPPAASDACLQPQSKATAQVEG